MKKNVLIIDGGGVAQVVAHKCAQNNDILGKITLASRTVEKCEAIAKSVAEKGSMKLAGTIQCCALDALDVAATAVLIREPQFRVLFMYGFPLLICPFLA